MRSYLYHMQQDQDDWTALNGKIVCRPPDTSTPLDAERGTPVTAGLPQCGSRLKALAFPCDPCWRTEAGVALVDARCFGDDADYASYTGPRISSAGCIRNHARLMRRPEDVAQRSVERFGLVEERGVLAVFNLDEAVRPALAAG